MFGDKIAPGSFWNDRRVIENGGNGFLGKHSVRKLRESSAEVFMADIGRYDLRHLECIRHALRDAKPQMVIHLAARVGGTGANVKHSGELFYDNLMMGTQLIRES